jgi:hypothetical protein
MSVTINHKDKDYHKSHKTPLVQEIVFVCFGIKYVIEMTFVHRVTMCSALEG